MARIDKAWVVVRGLAGTALLGGGTVYGVRINSGGSIVPSGTAAGEGAFGVICLQSGLAAGEAVGVLKHGEIVEFGGSAGSVYNAGATGTVGLGTTNATQVGRTLEGDRLVVDL